MARKKVVFVIVEGTTDQDALEGTFRNIYNPESVKFCIVRGDITTESKPNLIKRKLSEIIKNWCDKNPILKTDIKKVIHLVDMDGAYIDENSIIEDPSYDEFVYSEENITAKSKLKVLERNSRKSDNLNVISKLSKVYSTLDYCVYYFSCDQEHVLHNRMNVEISEKERLAEIFNDRYEEDFDGFKEFICSEDLKVNGSYRETWEFIKCENNSLKRFSNLHLLLEEEGIV